MTRLWKHTYMKAIYPRYQRATREQKKAMLDEFCETYECHRKHAIRLLSGAPPEEEPAERRGGRPGIYQRAVIKVLEEVWEATHYLWSVRLKAALPVWMPWIRERFALTAAQEKQLRSISPATIDRQLAAVKRRLRRKTYGTTKPGTLLKHMIPIQTQAWDVRKPGYLEVDTVAHCGTTTEGTYLSTLDTTDLDTTWSERRAILGKGQAAVVEAFGEIEEALPFNLRGLDSDSGSEFINQLLYQFCQEHKIRFTRSRPYKKDDNAHIEQKNWTHVRKLFGYARFESELAKAAINDLYKNELRLFQNVFQPSVKLLKKVRKGARITRVYDKPKTPWQRVLLSKHADPQKVKTLQRQIAGLDPFKLSETIDKKLATVQKLLAKGPAPKPTFHPDWGRRKISDLGAPAGIPTSTLAHTIHADNFMLKRIHKNLRKERFLQTA
jgi:hypothetical protein